MAAVVAGLLCTLVLLNGACGQGLAKSGQLRSSNDYSRLLAKKYFASLALAQALSKRYAGLSRSARASCKDTKAQRANAGLCAGFDALDSEELAIAASPQVFSWINPKTTGAAAGVATQSNPFAPVGDQGDCWTSVSFVVTATAEAAVVRALGLPGGSVRMSAQDLGFCPEIKNKLRFCQTSWDLQSALTKLQQRTPVAEHCLMYTIADPKSSNEAGSNYCNYACQTLDPATAGGRFVPRQVRTLAAAQRTIRMFGGVVTGINIYNDFRPFFAAKPRGVYQGKQCEGGDASQLESEHAVVLVGYNNTGQFWVARNSWGPKFGDNGYFRISYGTCGVGSLGDMYGIAFAPDRPRKIPINVTPDVDNAGCYIYRARPGDSLGALADSWDIDVRSLILNNSGVIDSLEEPLAGKLLTVCNLSSNGVDLKTPSWMLTGNATAGLPSKAGPPVAMPTPTPRPTPPPTVTSAPGAVPPPVGARQAPVVSPPAQQPFLFPNLGGFGIAPAAGTGMIELKFGGSGSPKIG